MGNDWNTDRGFVLAKQEDFERRISHLENDKEHANMWEKINKNAEDHASLRGEVKGYIIAAGAVSGLIAGVVHLLTHFIK